MSMSMSQHFIIGDGFILEPDRYRLIAQGKEILLSQKETALLMTLCIFSLSVVERSHLLNSIWGDSESADIGLNKSILMLRRKFEACGVTKAIQTVPRIGYMLLLEAKAIAEDSAIEITTTDKEVDEDDVSANSTPPTEEIDILQPCGVGNKKRRKMIYTMLIACMVSLISVYFFQPHFLGNDYLLIDSVDRYDNPFGVLFISKDVGSELSSDITHTISNINAVFKRIADHVKYYILVSKGNISIVTILHNGERKQSNFLVDDGAYNFGQELQCAVNKIADNNYPTLASEEIRNSNVKFVSMRFFSRCQDKKFLLDLNIKRSGAPSKIKTVLQTVSAKNSKGIALFHFDRTSERNEIAYPDGTHQAIFHNSPASFNIDADDIIGNSIDTLKIIDAFTSPEAKQTIIDKKHGVFMSDVMGGILYIAT